MTATRDRIYQASDLAGAGRKAFIEDALNSRARLRSTAGDSLVMLRETRLEHLAAIRDYSVAYLTLELALRRARADRRLADYGAWAFMAAFDDDDIEDFLAEVTDAIVGAVSSQDHEELERLIHEWRLSAHTASDPVAREILEGQSEGTDWVEATYEG